MVRFNAPNWGLYINRKVAAVTTSGTMYGARMSAVRIPEKRFTLWRASAVASPMKNLKRTASVVNCKVSQKDLRKIGSSICVW